MAKRFPVYLVLDVSGSMGGSPIQAVENGLTTLKSALMSNPNSSEIAWVSIITFGGNDAKQSVPLTPLDEFNPPTLRASGGTPLTEALQEVTECAVREKKQGDARPLVFLMTDGEPDGGVDLTKFDLGNPDLHFAINTFLNHHWIGIGACAAGSGANVDFLRKFTVNNGEDVKELREVIVLDTTDQAGFEKFFQIVTNTTVKGSTGLIKDGYDPNSPAS
ncbi:MAG: VWA domain-containing protein [Planctomycetaceae bacterium]|jgi:uncharacterized protein YegL|nr:VWA domain-containing protein [Planctomycetaceae bacterium]